MRTRCAGRCAHRCRRFPKPCPNCVLCPNYVGDLSYHL